MSSNDNSNTRGESKSPTGAKGGKSLEMMHRMKSTSASASTSPVPTPAPAAAPRAAATSGPPKGKDFAAMSARAPQRTSPAAPSSEPPQQQPRPAQGGKPKGKDFSAMATRMGAQQQQQQQPAGHARAAQLQNDARVAAGYVPPATARPSSGSNTKSRPASVSSSRPVAATTPTAKQPPTLSGNLQPTGKATQAPESSTGRLATASKAPMVGQCIQDLVRQLDPAYTIDGAAQQQVLQLADDFLDKVCRQSVRLAQHRGSKTVDVQDVQWTLSKQWGIVIAGLGPPVASASVAVKRKRSKTSLGSVKKAAVDATGAPPSST